MRFLPWMKAKDVHDRLAKAFPGGTFVPKEPIPGEKSPSEGLDVRSVSGELIRALFVRIGQVITYSQKILDKTQSPLKRYGDHERKRGDALKEEVYAITGEICKHLDIPFDPSATAIPEDERMGYDQILLVMKGMTAEGLYQLAKKLGLQIGKFVFEVNGVPTDAETINLDNIVKYHERDPEKGSYAIRIQPTGEVDDELYDHSADECAEKGVWGLTLIEALLYLIVYFLKTGTPIGEKTFIACTGTQFKNEGVPSLDCLTGTVFINCWKPSACPQGMGTKRVRMKAA